MKGTRTKSLKEALKTQEPEHNNLLNVIVEQQLKKPNMWKHKKSQHHQNYEQSLKQNND